MPASLEAYQTLPLTNGARAPAPPGCWRDPRKGAFTVTGVAVVLITVVSLVASGLMHREGGDQPGGEGQSAGSASVVIRGGSGNRPLSPQHPAATTSTTTRTLEKSLPIPLAVMTSTRPRTTTMVTTSTTDVPRECSKDGVSCSQTHCCESPGMQCYHKADDWAVCRGSCIPGPDPSDVDSTPWSCRKLGNRTQGLIPVDGGEAADWVEEECSGPGENCAKSRCCKQPGMQCFFKADDFAGCRSRCTPGPDIFDANNDPWNCTALGMKTPGEAPPDGDGEALAPWVKDDCAGNGQDCSKSRCCADPGMQCYEKAPGWAQCKVDCIPGPDLTDANSAHWSCERWGPRTPGEPIDAPGEVAAWVKEECAGPGGNCTKSKCCREEGMQCYTKQDHWSGCKPLCIPGPDPTDANNQSWECEALGPRTPGPIPALPDKAADWVKETCAGEGENCMNSKCCKDEGMQCYVKKDGWAGCRASCLYGPNLQDDNADFWNCSTVGSRTPGKIPDPAGWVMEWVTTNCSKPTENCMNTRCCSTAGNQCYEKEDGWATCRSSCFSGPDIFDQDNTWWTCEEMGPRTPGDAPPEAKQEVAAWVREECSGESDDCSKTQCCKDDGMQCYEKAPGWAMCKASCAPGPDLYDENSDHWSCETLGPRTPGEAEVSEKEVAAWVRDECSAPGEDCQETLCCKDDGLQCYSKDDFWATCKASCAYMQADPKDEDDEPWHCDKLGVRTPGNAPCVEAGEDCRHSNCCSDPGMQCYEKDSNWASCMQLCDTSEEGMSDWSCRPLGNRSKFGHDLGCAWPGDDCGLSQVCCQEGQTCYKKDDDFAGCTNEYGLTDEWDGQVLGGSRVTSGLEKLKNGSNATNVIKPAEPGYEAGTSLYCFMAVLMGEEEEKLMYLMKDKQAGIFGCDRYDIKKAHRAQQKSEGSWNSVANTAVFIDIWQWVLKGGAFLTCDWTVKIDPDTVFFPDRLRDRIAALRPPANTAIYLKNTYRYNGFLGAIEIFSKQAVERYSDFGNGCSVMAEGSGEDGYFKGCMDAVGASYMLDDDLLSSMGYPKFCGTGHASFHPFKTVEWWLACYDIATGKYKWSGALDKQFTTV